MEDFAVEYDEEANEYVATAGCEEYCTPIAHLAYLWLAAQIVESEPE